MTQEEKSLQRGAEWEQWGINPWQATERSDRSGTSQNWNVEEMIRVVLTHQRGFSGFTHCLAVFSSQSYCGWYLALLGLVSSQWGSISPARPGQASLQCQPPSQGLPGTNIRNQPGKYEIFIKYLLDFQNISDCQQCLSCKHWKPTSNLQSRYSPSQLGRAFHWLDITLGHDPPHAF